MLMQQQLICKSRSHKHQSKRWYLSATIADTTGVMTVPSSVLTTSDINGGNIDNTIMGSQTPSSATFTNITVNDQNAIIFEGSTGDNYETTISIEDPTDDRTITVPNMLRYFINKLTQCYCTK